MEKIAMFVFRGDPMCFIHVLLNGLDMHRKNYDIKIIIEGEATKLLPELVKDGNPMKKMWAEMKEKNLVAGVCKACAVKMGTFEEVENQNLKPLNDMSGHPSMSFYIDEGYKIITF